MENAFPLSWPAAMRVRYGVDGRGPSAPVQDQFTLLEVPGPVNFVLKPVQISKGGDHDLAFALVTEQVMGDGVALPGGLVTVKGYGLWPLKWVVAS